jgi:hypothetical protein
MITTRFLQRRFLSNVTPDGRTSLKYNFSKILYKDFQRNWLKDPSTYPIMAIIGIASTCATSFGFYSLYRENNVSEKETKF